MPVELPGHICGICRAGPFPTTPGLRRHIRQARGCRQAAEKEISNYLDNIWSKEPDDVLPTIQVTSTISSSITVSVDDDDILDVDLAAAAIFGQDDLDEDEPHHHHHPVSLPEAALHPGEVAEPIANSNYEYIESFPSKYNAGIGWKPAHGESSNFDVIHQRQDRNNYAPFKDKDDWQVGHWLMTNVSQTQANAFLELPIIQRQLQPSYKNKTALLKKIDTLPTQACPGHVTLFPSKATGATKMGPLWPREADVVAAQPC
ncbi:hypothetical protein BGW80DRAFT_1468940 [Lactifluus volemus]|nr:hypothetical protein BGW80DRAFT_1468940 [Lactifluus volemus]